MECFILFVFFFVFLAAVAGAVWLGVLTGRARANAVRIEELAKQIEELAGGPAAPPIEVEVPATGAAPVDAAQPAAEVTAQPPAPLEVATTEVGPVEPSTAEAPAAESEAAPAPERPPSPPTRIDWERWVGVRGAAVLGSAVLALAGFLFLKFSIEQGLIPPGVRVALGLLSGVGCLVGSESLRRRFNDYQATANALAGAGVVLLYAAVWAAGVLYALIPSGFAFGLMALVTVACGVLSWRYSSLVIAVLGLVGGFATPALLSTGQDSPIGLFGYLLLLNTGLLVLAARRRWPLLAGLSLALTVLYQAFWIFTRMQADRVWLGLVIVTLFAAVYAVAGRRAPSEEGSHERSGRLLTQAAGVLLPFAFACYFAGNAGLGARLYPTGILLLLLTLLAQWIGHPRRPFFALAAAAGGLAVVAVWCLRTDFNTPLAWEGVAVGLALALAWQAFAELGLAGSCRAALLTAAGFLLLFLLVPLGMAAPSYWPWLTGWLGLAALLCRQSTAAEQGWRQLIAALGLGLGIGLFFQVHGGPSLWPVLFSALAAAVAFQILALPRRGEIPLGSVLAGPRAAEAAVVLPLVVLILLAGGAPAAPGPRLMLAATFALGLLTALAATRLRSGGWYFAATALSAWNHWCWSRSTPELPDAAGVALGALALQAVAVVLFTAWPFLAGKSFLDQRWAWVAAALAGPAWFFSLKRLFETRFGDAAIGILPVALGGLALAAAFRARRLWTPQDPLGRSRLVWFAAVALGFGSVAIPLQLEKEWITLGWALEGLAVTVLWKRLDHPGLKYFGLALFFAATVRLVANPALPGYYPLGGRPIVNWLLYTYLVPAAALIAGARLLAPREVERRRGWEKLLYSQGWPVAAIACGLAAIGVIFVWINLEIFHFFSSGDRLLISFDRLPARDLTTSLAWIGYALVLLALGLARASRGLRWISLAFLVLAIGKVFLYDLGELGELYRVASLLGLAVSLILVSLAYQRFVFGKRPASAKK